MISPDLVLDALGNPVRRQLLLMLRDEPRSVGALAAGLPISRPAVSKHLKLLEGAHLVRQTRAGTQHVFALDPEGIGAARGWLDTFWDEALPRFRLLAEHLPEAP